MSLSDDKKLYLLMTQADELQKDAVALHEEVKRVAEEAQEGLQKAFKSILRKNLHHTLILVCAGLLIAFLVICGCTLYISYQMKTVKKLEERAQVWKDKAGEADLQVCGDKNRLCVRVDKTAGGYGDNGEYMVINGY